MKNEYGELFQTYPDIVDVEGLYRLRDRCAFEVKSTKGRIKLDDAVEFQQGI